MWLAQREASGFALTKTVAVKWVALEPSTAPTFAREAAVAMSVSHSGLVTAFDAGVRGGHGFLVLEWVDGFDLAVLVALMRAQGRRLPRAVAASIVARILRALDYLHRLHGPAGWLGLVHGDLSPRNVLVSRSGEVKVTDFGAAHRRGDAQDTRRGTRRYMAPEQAHADRYDARADLFAAGALLDELVRAEPFERDRGTAPIVGSPVEIETVRRGLLEPDPARRVMTAPRAAAMLEHVEGPRATSDLARIVAELLGRDAPHCGTPSPSGIQGATTVTVTRRFGSSGGGRLAASVWAASMAAGLAASLLK